MSLKEAIEDSSISSFSMTQDYKGPLSDLAGLLLNRTFTLYGNDHVIDGNSGRGLLVQSDASDTWHQTLHVKNATFQNFKFNTNEPDFYALVNQSKTILNGVHFKNNYDKNGNLVDIANSGTLVFEGAESTLTGSIIAGGPGRGDIHILGTNLDMSHGVIEQKDIFIDDFGSLYVDADNLKLTGSVSNDGMVALGSGKLTADISGDGFTRILGDVQNSFDRTINQDIHVVEDGVFTTDILYAKKEFANYGVLNLTGSVISDKNLIYGDGTLNIDSTMSNNAKTISQSNINIAQNTTFTNSNTSQIYATELLRNKGAIDNSGIIDAILDNQGSIGGDGELNVYGISVNSGAIDVGSLNLKNALFTNANANADVLKAVNDINIDELSTLITNATAVGSKVQNSGILGLIGGTLNKEVSGDGVVQIAGDVTSNAKIEQTGVNVQEGTLSNENTIIATVVVQEKGTLNSKIENITGTIFNDGVFNIDGAIILNEIIGDGVLNVKNNLVNSSYIKQNIINIGSAYSFNSNASDINSKVKNDGVYNIDGGVVLGAVSGSGVVNIEDDTLFNAIVAQSQINIKEHNTLISNASFVKGLVENASVLYLTGGTLTSAVQGDNGLLYITDERVTNNANIDQDAIYVVSSLTNNSNISANLVQNEGEINNGGYIFSNLYNAKQIIGNGTYGLKGYSQNLANASFTQKLIELNEAVFDNNGTVRADLLSVDGSSILISNASNINSKVRNDGLYNVLGGTIGQDIYKSASSENSILDILGEVRNSANVSQNYIEIDGAGRLINDGVMSADVLFENDGVFINNKTLTASALINENLITNDGVIAGSLNNVGVINGTGAFNLLGTSLNNGMLSQDNITLANAILINENTIKAKSVHVDSLSTLQSIADEVQSKVSNDGIYQVLGGSIGWDVLGVGQMNILENSTNIANITQKYIYVASEKTLTNSTGSITADLIHVDSDITSASSLNPAVLHVHNASNVNSAVLNDGIYRVVNGEIKKDVGGVGELYIRKASGLRQNVLSR